MKSFTLNDEVSMPVMGLGTWDLKGETCVRAVQTALEIGYRHIDTAMIYNNQPAIAKGIATSSVPREEVFITSKIWRTRLKKDALKQQFKEILEELDTDYLDLLLIHWPDPSVPVQETLGAMDELSQAGKIKAIGVSNFMVEDLKEALATGIEFKVNQIEYHPNLQQEAVRQYAEENGIVVTAYSPLDRVKALRLEIIQKLAEKYGKSPAQVVLNWLLAKDMVVIPKASSREHIEDNFRATEWQLEESDIAAIDSLSG